MTEEQTTPKFFTTGCGSGAASERDLRRVATSNILG